METKPKPEVGGRWSIEREAFNLEQIHILERIAVGAPLKEVLERIVLLIEQQGDGLGSILLLDREQGRVVHGAAPNLPGEFSRAIEGAHIGPQAGSCGTAAYRGERVIVRDIETHPYWKDYRQFALPHGLRACWSSPIFSPAREVLGTFAVYYPEPREPKEDELHWVDSATHLAAIAIMKNQGELALRRSEARYRQILETTHEGVISLDIDAKVKFANRRAGEMLGYGSSELLGRNVSELLDPSERRKVEAMLARRRRGMSDQYEVHMRTREGRDLWVIIASSAVVDESGEVAGMLGMLTDITHRKQTEVVLGRSEAELRTMFESAAIGMALVDPITRPVKCNPALEKFLAYSAAELGQTTLLELTHSDDCSRFWRKSACWTWVNTIPFKLKLAFIRRPGNMLGRGSRSLRSACRTGQRRTPWLWSRTFARARGSRKKSAPPSGFAR